MNYKLQKINVLIIEDKPFDFRLLEKIFSTLIFNYQLTWKDNLKDGLLWLKKGRADIVLLDLNLPDSMGMETLKSVCGCFPELPVVVLTAERGEDIIFEVLEYGAQDYLEKGRYNPSILDRSIQYAIERKHKENEINKQNVFLNSVIESLSYPFLVIDAENYSTHIANMAARDETSITGFVFDHDGNVIFQQYYIDFFEEIKACGEKITKICRNEVCVEPGKVAELSGYPVFDRAHFMKQIILCSLDITEQDRNKSELQKLGTVIRQFSDSIMIMDNKGLIEYVNPAFEENFKYSKHEVAGKNAGFLFENTESPSFLSDLHNTFAEKKTWKGRLRLRGKDNQFFESDVRLFPIMDEDGKITETAAVSRDITEELKLRSIVEAANLTENIGYVFSGIRHELGNPINSVKTTLTVLNNNLSVYSKEKIREFTERSLKEINRVEYLLKLLKNYSQYETPDIRLERIDLFLTNFVALVGDDFKKKRIEITVDIQSPDVLGIADPRALNQVFLNIFSNSADALVDTNSPTISIRQYVVNDKICIEIADNGKGMTEKEQESLFKPFNTTKRGGTGLGLVIVQKMLAQMNCSIKVVSKLNVGTTVIILLESELPSAV